MMFGYYDNLADYPNMYAGPTNGGVFPMDNTAWGYGECPLSATHMGYDDRATRGHVDDYWVAYLDPGPDPFITNGWVEHMHADCTADFMGTNQSNFNAPDGGTYFFINEDGSPLSDYTGSEPDYRDGCHGMRLFAESRGYSVTENFTQLILNSFYGNTEQGFTFEDFQAEIDAGRPLEIGVTGHSMLGFGYDADTGDVYIHDTWDHSDHTMPWGGIYSGMAHYSVTVVRLVTPPIIEIIHPRNNRAIFSTNPLIQASITDPEEGVDETSIGLEIDEAPIVGFAYDSESGLLTYEASLAEGAHQVTVRAKNDEGDEAEKTHSFRILQKSFDAGLHLFSLPYTYGPGQFPTPDSLFGLSPGDVAMHRWWAEDNNVNKYRTYPDNYGTFNPPDAMGGDPIVESPPAGLGYFIRLPQQVTVQEPGTILDGGVTTYEIELRRGLVPPRGWSMIGCPFSQALDWGSVEFVTDGQAQSITEAVEDGVTDGILWEFVSTGSGGYYNFPYDPLSATLEPFKGYWVHVWEDTTLRLNALALDGAGVTPADSSGNFESDDEWQLQIIASAGGDVDPCNYIGVTSAATSGYDSGLDVTEPPSVGSAVQCYQPRADWDEYSGNYARDIRSTVAGSQTWDVDVSCQLSGEPVTVRWPELNSVVPGAVKFMLEDVGTGQQVYMRTTTGYSFTSPEGGGIRHLRITAYDDSVTSLTLTGVSAQAMSPSGGAVITYSLSKPATVAAEICNISGVTIKGLGERSSSGSQVEMILWDGRSDRGTKVPAGRYLARITAWATDGQTVQAVRPFVILP